MRLIHSVSVFSCARIHAWFIASIRNVPLSQAIDVVVVDSFVLLLRTFIKIYHSLLSLTFKDPPPSHYPSLCVEECVMMYYANVHATMVSFANVPV